VVESESSIVDFNKKESLYILTLTGNVKDKKGQVKVVARNNGGEVSSESELIICGRAPEFIEKPQKCTILEGT